MFDHIGDTFRTIIYYLLNFIPSSKSIAKEENSLYVTALQFASVLKKKLTLLNIAIF